MDIEACADQIAEAGIARVYGVLGSGRSLELADALARRQVKVQPVHHEMSAALMAGTGGLLSGRCGIALSIKGPGLANMLPGLAACQLESWPVLGIAEANGPDVPEAKAHKRMRHDLLAAGVAKGRRYLSRQGPDLAALLAWAEREAPGPVLADLAGPLDDIEPAIPPEALAVHDDDAVLALLDRAERPLVIAGTLAQRRGWNAVLNDLEIPLFCTAAAKGAIDETGPLSAGVYTGIGGPLAPETALLPLADLIVGFGLRPGEMLGVAPFPAPAVNLDAIAPRGVEGFGFAAVASPDSAPAVLARLAARSWGADEVRGARQALAARMLSGPFLPAQAFAALAEAFETPPRLVVDTGYFCTIAEHAWPARGVHHYLGAGAGRYMGIALAQAIAAAQHDPQTPVVAAIGDGGIGPLLAEARIARQQDLPICILHMSDGGHGSVRTRAIADGLDQAPLLIAEASWRGAFEGFGWPTFRAVDADELAERLAGWQTADGPVFIELPFDPDAYQAMVRGIR